MFKLIQYICVLFLGVGLFSGCHSQPIKPEAGNIKVTREPVAKDCEDLGPVEGRSSKLKSDFEAALEDLKKDAALKGATHVKLETTSAMGTAVRGQAYRCP